MTAKRILLTFAALFALIVGSSYLNYRSVGLSRTVEDRTIQRLTRASNGDAIHTVVLSDSVTNVPTTGYVPEEGVAFYTTVGGLRLAGQYALARRYLDNNKPKRLYVFAVPETFLRRVDNEGPRKVRYTYFDTVFWNWDERYRLFEANDDQAFWHSFFYDVMLKGWRSRTRPLDEPPRVTYAPSKRETPMIGEEIYQKHDYESRALQFRDGYLDPQNAVVLKQFDTLCKTHSVECTLVIEPASQGDFVYNDPYWRKKIDFSAYAHLRVLDLNFDNGAQVVWPNHAFVDGVHFAANWFDYYAATINQKVAPLIKTGAVWDGSPVMIDRSAGKLEFYQFFQHEQNGRWLSDEEGKIEFDFAASASGAGVKRLRLGGRAIASVERPLTLTVTINGTPVGTASYDKNWELTERELSFDAKLLLPGRNTIGLKSSHTVVPGNGEARKLGYTLNSIALVQ